MATEGWVRRAGWAALVAVACAGCAPTAGDKPIGWPPTEGGPPYPRDAGVTDAFVDSTALPEVAVDTALAASADGEVFAAGPCAQLVQLACELSVRPPNGAAT